MKKSTLFLFFILFFSACTSRVTIESIQSAKVQNVNSKQLALMPLKNDTIAQGSSISTELAHHKINKKPYFELVERDNIQKLLAEKRLNDSALVDIEDLSSIKGLSQAKTFLMGEVIHSRLDKRRYSKVVNNYNRCAQYNKENQCIRYAKIFMHCQNNTYSVLTHIKLVEVESSNILFAQNYNEKVTLNECGSDIAHLPSKQQYNSALARKIAQRVLKDIAPTYKQFSVTLLDSLDISLQNTQEKMFENALDLIQAKRYKKAQVLLEELSTQTKAQSYVILYNLALSYEALNELEKAKKLYEKAEQISLKTKLNETISQALVRVEHNIEEKKSVNGLIK